MSRCGDISAFLDGRLERDEAERFEGHLEGCAVCRREVEAWQAITARIADVSNADAAAADPTAHEQLRLVQRAEIERDLPRLGTVRLALAASVLLALGVVTGFFLAGPTTAPTGPEKTSADDGAPSYTTDASSRTSVRLGDDAIYLGPVSRVRVLASGSETHLALDRGSLACEVADREGAGSFSVETPGFSVRVTGTRFLVELGADERPARVVVSAGAVEVRSGHATHRLGQGRALELAADALVREASAAELTALERLLGGPPSARTELAGIEPPGQPDTDTAPPPAAHAAIGAGSTVARPAGSSTSELERWRAWVIEGRLDEARSALRSHLESHPRDAAAWSLLADCERKRASWDDAVAAYDELVSLSAGEQADRARYKAALILQDRLGDHRRAIELLERFVEGGTSGGGLLVDKARVRLARSLAATGKLSRARTQLEQVIENAADAETVAAARQLLEQLDRE